MNFAHQFNVHFAGKIKEARTSARLSQQALADKIGGGLSASQISKYEKAKDRAAASTLWDISCATGRSILWFFEGLPL
jgi:transcriptional regulator with XRE-family HTH domain